MSDQGHPGKGSVRTTPTPTPGGKNHQREVPHNPGLEKKSTTDHPGKAIEKPPGKPV